MPLAVSRVLKSHEFQYGMCVLAFGLAGLYLASSLRLGTVIRMGPGFVPTVLGWLLTGMGLMYIGRSFFSREGENTDWGFRPIALVLGSIAFFLVAIEHLGLPIAVAGLTLISAVAEGSRRSWVEWVTLAVGLSMFCSLLFVFALGLTIPLLPKALQ
jgi:hypothetical protein